MCDIPYLLDKCTLDKMPERSKIIENIGTLFSLTLVSIKFRKKIVYHILQVFDFAILGAR